MARALPNPIALEDARLRYALYWNDLVAHSRSGSAKQSRHLNDGCVENVKDELRRDANGEHEQSHGNHDEFFPAQKIGEHAATFCEWPAEKRLHRSHKNDGCDEKADHGDGRE